jgi:hypothetical protein
VERLSAANTGRFRELARRRARIGDPDSQGQIVMRRGEPASGVGRLVMRGYMLDFASRLLMCWASWWLVGAPTANAAEPARIDRHALVTRHNPTLDRFDRESPLTVGNGEFAFTVDATGLQTFPEAFDDTTPLGTLSQWGWHSAPNPHHWSIDTYPMTPFDSHGGQVGYADILNGPHEQSDYLRANPHRLHLGQIGFRLTNADGTPAQPSDLADIHQTLDLWEGIVRSHFTLDGQPVDVQTVCHPTEDTVAVRVESPLVASDRLAIRIRFPYGTGDARTADWSHPDAHRTTLKLPKPPGMRFERQVDDSAYEVDAAWEQGNFSVTGPHDYSLAASGDQKTLDLVCRFSPTEPANYPANFDETLAAACDHWRQFWTTGGAIDLSASRDPRWQELERRIVLSQYLTVVQSAATQPTAETGLTYNSWYGKFHLEMQWWHAVHFALWSRWTLFDPIVDYYQAILPRARETAKRQGYAGARWPKMTDPSGAESPSTIGPFLIWQQPHPIYYAELAYGRRPNQATLDAWRDIVLATADFMASYATRDETTGRYLLGPPLESAQEVFPKATTINPTFELTYWRWGLAKAVKWRERLGMPREPKWDDVLAHLAQPSVVDGKYAFTETTPDSFTNPAWRRDHPIVLGSFGMLAGPGIDEPTMKRTLDWVWGNWNWESTWGWDYPMIAMCAARLGEPERAVDALLRDTPKNHYGLNGQNYQRPGLSVYLPGNGGLLTAAAMMAAGWQGGPARDAPGFPNDGSWNVRWEGLRPLP